MVGARHEEALVISRVHTHFAHNVVGYLALFVALSGSAYAVGTVTSADIRNRTIKAVDIRPGTLPSIRSSLNPGEYATKDDMTEVSSLTLDKGSRRYLVIANFSTTGDVTPFECQLTAGGFSNDARVTGQGSQTMVLVVSASSEVLSTDLVARLSCADHNAGRQTNPVNRTMVAVRVKT
jgi:hypothetical protein